MVFDTGLTHQVTPPDRGWSWMTQGLLVSNGLDIESGDVTVFNLLNVSGGIECSGYLKTYGGDLPTLLQADVVTSGTVKIGTTGTATSKVYRCVVNISDASTVTKVSGTGTISDVTSATQTNKWVLTFKWDWGTAFGDNTYGFLGNYRVDADGSGGASAGANYETGLVSGSNPAVVDNKSLYVNVVRVLDSSEGSFANGYVTLTVMA